MKKESSEEDSEEEEARIREMQKTILREEEKRFRALSRKYSKNKNVDMSRGRCCFRYENESGARCVQVIDMLFIPNLPRWIFAIWARVDNDRWPIYARMRKLSFYLFWLILFGIFAYDAVMRIFFGEDQTQEQSTELYINSIFYLAALCTCVIVDFHWLQVVQYSAKTHARRIKKEKKAQEKKLRATERYNRASHAVVYGDD